MLLNPSPAEAQQPSDGVPDDALAALLAADDVSEADLRAIGVEVEVKEFVAIGGGMGSFAWVDLLRNSGVPASRIAVVTNESKGAWRYRRYVANSQMVPPRDRIRSNSESRPDNIWGFPGYALREAWCQAHSGHWRRAVGLVWRVMAEPVAAETYTPRAEDVFRTMDREAVRIDWHHMYRQGDVFALRRTREGRIMAVARRGPDGRAYGLSARFMQLGLGYPDVRVLPEVLRYRAGSGDTQRVVNAYAPHDHVYAALFDRSATVLVRGRGIAASRVVERLWEARAAGAPVRVVHLHRRPMVSGYRFGLGRRALRDDFEFQPFNWPKGCWGGELKSAIEHASDEERRVLHERLGGTSTANRELWRRIIEQGRREGWYCPEYGEVTEFVAEGDGVRVEYDAHGGGKKTLAADFVVDCTGMAVEPERNPLLADLFGRYNVRRNGLGRLAVTNNFEIEGLRHGEARVYACGAMTLGGPSASVDTFLGLQYAAFRSAFDIHEVAPASLRLLNGAYSIRQWWKWLRGRPP